MDSSPDVIYRFEPFHRLGKSDPGIRRWMDRLKAQDVSESDVPEIYGVLRPAHPLTNKAPFFEHKAYRLRTLGRAQLWPLARMITPARSAYSAAYSPESGPMLVFKEVTFVRQLRSLIAQTTVPIIYLVRHPCATVLSALNAPGEGAIATRQGHLQNLLSKNAPHLLERHPGIAEGSDPVARNALLWLYEVESCATIVRESPKGMLITYEQLADDAYLHAKAMFEHIGITFGDQTRRYLDALYGSGPVGSAGPKRTGWGRRYFSVYRNPREQKDSWKRRMSAEDRTKVEKIVMDSEAVKYCAEIGGWS